VLVMRAFRHWNIFTHAIPRIIGIDTSCASPLASCADGDGP
jgi:hypothetical protein